MTKYLRVRLSRGVVTLVLVAVVIFLLTHMMGSPVLQLLPANYTQKDYDVLNHALGYDRSLIAQFTTYVSNLLHGDLGDSTTYSRPVVDVIMERLPVTATLAGLALFIGGLAGLSAGFVTGYSGSRSGESLVTFLATIGLAVPPFAIGMVLILVFAVKANVLPSGGWGSWNQALMPVATLALIVFSSLARVARSSMRERVELEFVTLAKTKGLSPAHIFFRHTVRPSLPPVLSYFAVLAGSLFSGAVVTEAVFGVPGLGTVAVNAVENRDQNLVIGIVLFSTFVFVLFNVLSDLVAAALDPRVRLTEESSR